MDLLELRKKKVLFIPTRNQSEQEYLASYHMKKGHFHSVTQRRLKLVNDLRQLSHYSGISINGECTKKSIENILKILFS